MLVYLPAARDNEREHRSLIKTNTLYASGERWPLCAEMKKEKNGSGSPSILLPVEAENVKTNPMKPAVTERSAAPRSAAFCFTRH